MLPGILRQVLGKNRLRDRREIIQYVWDITTIHRLIGFVYFPQSSRLDGAQFLHRRFLRGNVQRRGKNEHAVIWLQIFKDPLARKRTRIALHRQIRKSAGYEKWNYKKNAYKSRKA